MENIEARWGELTRAWARKLVPGGTMLDGEARTQDDYYNMLLGVAWCAMVRFQREHPAGTVDEIKYVRGAIRRAAFSASRFRTTRERLRRALAARVHDWESLGWLAPASKDLPEPKIEARSKLRLVIDNGFNLEEIAGCDPDQDSRALYRMRNRVRKSDARQGCEI